MAAVLDELSQLCVATGYPSTLMPFYRLRFARSDLSTQTYQHYWQDADRSNIDDIVYQEARRWLGAHD